MPERVTDTFISDGRTTASVLYVWTDSTADQLRAIQGIAAVTPWIGDGHYQLYLDPRYDVEAIKDEVAALIPEDTDAD